MILIIKLKTKSLLIFTSRLFLDYLPSLEHAIELVLEALNQSFKFGLQFYLAAFFRRIGVLIPFGLSWRENVVILEAFKHTANCIEGFYGFSLLV